MTKKNIISIGIDLSLTGTGIVILNGGKIIKQQLIKSKPVGDRPTDEIIRLKTIVEEIELIIGENFPDIVVIENLAFAVRKTTALTQLAGLSFLVRSMLVDYRVPFYMCAPTTLKRFATGKGNSEKDHMILEAFKKYGVDFIDNNIADALFLAKIGSAIKGHEKIVGQHQVETIELMKKQS
jgi:crossover junction endodeoxyribonuclease RuvC